MEKTNCTNCGAPDQDPTQECTYCGHRLPIQATAATATTAENVVTLQGDISRFKLLLASLLVGWAAMAIGTWILGG